MDEEFMTAEEIRQEIAKLKLRLAFQQDFEDEVGTLRGNAFPARVKRLCDGLKARTELEHTPAQKNRVVHPQRRENRGCRVDRADGRRGLSHCGASNGRRRPSGTERTELSGSYIL